jgi:hypothetical protein
MQCVFKTKKSDIACEKPLHRDRPLHRPCYSCNCIAVVEFETETRLLNKTQTAFVSLTLSKPFT